MSTSSVFHPCGTNAPNSDRACGHGDLLVSPGPADPTSWTGTVERRAPAPSTVGQHEDAVDRRRRGSPAIVEEVRGAVEARQSPGQVGERVRARPRAGRGRRGRRRRRRPAPRGGAAPCTRCGRGRTRRPPRSSGAGHHHRAARPSQVDRPARGRVGRLGRDVHDHVGAATPVAPAARRTGSSARHVDGEVGAEPPASSSRGASLARAGDHHEPGAGVLGRGHGRQAADAAGRARPPHPRARRRHGDRPTGCRRPSGLNAIATSGRGRPARAAAASRAPGTGGWRSRPTGPAPLRRADHAVHVRQPCRSQCRYSPPGTLARAAGLEDLDRDAVALADPHRSAAGRADRLDHADDLVAGHEREPGLIPPVYCSWSVPQSPQPSPPPSSLPPTGGGVPSRPSPPPPVGSAAPVDITCRPAGPTQDRSLGGAPPSARRWRPRCAPPRSASTGRRSWRWPPSRRP